MAMKVEQDLHMVGGVGVTSYASNSRLQEKAIYRTKPMVEEAVREVYNTLLPENFAVADLGCSSGPNTFIVISEIIDVISDHCRKFGRRPPEMQCFLNDLPGTDFITVFRYSTWIEKLVRSEKEEEIAPPRSVVGVLGSFYGRLFPNHSIHFVHSSYCLMWLSQVPEGLESAEGVPMNKGNIYIAKTSPPSVVRSYSEQFQRDFSTFLRLRSKELVPKGRMVLTFLGRRSFDASNGELSCLWGLLANALNAMVLEGFLNQREVDTFNLPHHAPSMEEVKAVIENEKSFGLDQVQIFESNWDPLDDSTDDIVSNSFVSGENVAKCIRAVMEPLLVKHFGESRMDDLFSRYAKNVASHLLKGKAKYVIFAISLERRAVG